MSEDVCPATRIEFDHRLARAGMSEDTKEAILREASKQYMCAVRGEPIECAGCYRKPDITKMFRCYYCGRYFCPACAGDHFGGSRFE